VSRNNLIAIAIGGLLLSVAAWLLYINIEVYEETEESSWSIEALRNPYLAAQQFMDRSGVPVTDVDSLARLDELDSVGTLFFSDPGQVQTPRQLRQVLDWLESGGNVIYTANSVGDEDDLLLAEFGVEVDWREYEADDDGEIDDRPLSERMRDFNRQIEEGKSREEITDMFEDDETSLTVVRFDGDIGELEIDFDNEIILTHEYFDDVGQEIDGYVPSYWANSQYGIHMIEFRIGDGLLTIISDPGVWTSYRIGLHDHAYLLWLMSSTDGNFAILRSVLRDSIWVLMGRNASELLIAASLLVLLWIWHRGKRFGRLLPRDRARRRALGEHFSSVSHYLWQRRQGVYLLTPLRQRILSRASLTLAGFAGADSGLQYELLAERCDLNPAAVSRAFDESKFNEASFVQTVRLLKLIEQSL
jgi:hypothetical protein